MSLYQKASLVQIPSGYKASADKLYSVVPSNGDGDFTVDSSPLATRVNKDGLIESVVADQARLNYDFTNPQDPHLLLEPTRTNRVFPNNSLTGYSIIGVTTSNNQTTAPNGANEGAKVQATTSGTAVAFKGFTGTSGVTHNISAFVKAGTHNQVRLQEGFSSSRIDVNLSTGTEVSSQNATNKKIEAYPNDWYRISFNFTSTSANLQFALYFNGSYTSGENVYLYGGQIEEGTYATSLIPTSGSILTRTVDSAQKLNQTLFTDYPFTVYAKASLDAIGNTIFSLNDTSSQNYYLAFYFPNSTQVGLLRRDLSTNDSDFYSFSGSVGTTYKIAVAFVSATAYKLYIDGTQIANITSGSSVPFNHNDISLGQFRITGDTATRNGIDEFMVFNEALSDTELQTLTS